MIEIFFTFWSASSHSTRSGVMGAVVMVTRARTAGDQEMCAGREPDNNCGGVLCWAAVVRWPQQSAA